MTNDARPDQIVVASDQVQLVLEKIGPARADETIRELGLTLVEFEQGQVNAIADRLAGSISEDYRNKLEGRLTDESPEPEPLDRLLTFLRGSFEEENGGWTPDVGKNRDARPLEFTPYADAGAFDLPRPVPRPSRSGIFAPMRRPTDSTVVGVLDTRIVPNSALGDRVFTAGEPLGQVPGPDEVPPGWLGHATFVTGIILDEAPRASVLARSALKQVPRKAGGSGWAMTLWDFAREVVVFKNSGVKVLNLSVGLPTGDARPPLVLKRAIEYLVPDIVVVAAAGNYGPGVSDEDRQLRGMPQPTEPFFPAALPGVLAVGGLVGDELPRDDAPRELVTFNPVDAAGEPATWIDIFVPATATAPYFGDRDPVRVELPFADGQELPSEEAFDGWAEWTGTSFSAARASGEIAKAYLARGTHDPAALEAAVADIRKKYQRP
jgi:membrane-anchored mycosin MYCP